MSEPAPLRVVHALPGRMRLKLETHIEDPAELFVWETMLKEAPGVQEVTVNPATRSLLVQYDPEMEHVFHHLGVRRLSGEWVPVQPEGPETIHKTPPTPTAKAIARGFWMMDRRLFNASGGKLDLKLAVPGALLGFGLFELLTGAELAAVTFPTLAWYAYNFFIHLHPEITV
ncbi:MAG: heavy-metal-associated domain-containing protein, partial [Armatimonadota bacterium]|nr:heavy-metal-associated domain-containing protein [Armatimonadota bacterium]